MASTKSVSFNDKGVYRGVGSLNGNATPLTFYVGHLRSVTIAVIRTAGAGADTVAVTGSNDGTNFGAVTSTKQNTGDDTALSALPATLTLETIRQGVEYLKFTVSGNTDTFSVIVSGATRN